MKTWLKQNWLLLLGLAAPFAYVGVVWDQIPERMPVHFDAAMRPNGWMHKPWAPLVMPLAGVFVVLVASVFFHFDPKMAKCNEDTRLHVKKVLNRILLAFVLFFSTCSITLLWAAWGNIAPVKNTLLYGMPLLFLVLGNSLGKLRPNYAAGIRLPWTLKSTAVWVRTHRFGGKLLVGISLVLLALAITQWQQDIYLWIVVGSLLGWAVVVTVYSFVISRQKQQGDDHKGLGAS
jgi:uncharacterized membrane protein